MINKGEKHLYEWQYRMSGGFFTGLMNIIAIADKDNIKLLSLAFPEEVSACIMFKTRKGYWEDVQKRYNEEIKTQVVIEDSSPSLHVIDGGGKASTTGPAALELIQSDENGLIDDKK